MLLLGGDECSGPRSLSLRYSDRVVWRGCKRPRLTNELSYSLVQDLILGHEIGGIVDVGDLHDDRKRCNQREGPARWGQVWYHVHGI